MALGGFIPLSVAFVPSDLQIFLFFYGSAICCMLYIKYSPKWSSHIYIMLV